MLFYLRTSPERTFWDRIICKNYELRTKSKMYFIICTYRINPFFLPIFTFFSRAAIYIFDWVLNASTAFSGDENRLPRIFILMWWNKKSSGAKSTVDCPSISPKTSGKQIVVYHSELTVLLAQAKQSPRDQLYQRFRRLFASKCFFHEQLSKTQTVDCCFLSGSKIYDSPPVTIL